jgi:hypothetical protein
MPRLSKKQAIEYVSAEPPEPFTPTPLLPSQFKVPRKDAKGVSAHINFYTAPYYVRKCQEMLGKVPDFLTPSDVYATALHYGFEWLEKQAEIGVTSVQSQLNAWMRICQETELDEDLMLATDKLRETVNRKLAHGAVEEAKRLVAEVRYATEHMPDGYYKKRALDFLAAEFGGLWNGTYKPPETKPLEVK